MPTAYGVAFQRLLSKATLKLVEKCGHLPQEERPDEFVDALLGFLRE